MHIIWYKHFGIMAAHRYAGCIVRWTHATMKSDKVTRMRREWKAQRDAHGTVRRFSATPSAKRAVSSSAMPLTIMAGRVRNA
jgi:hypothetical protein